MRAIFYIFWIWYALLLSVELIGITVPVEYAKYFLSLYYLNFAFPAIAMGGLFYTEDLRLSKMYSLAICLSVFLRTVFWILQTHGYDNKYFLLVLCFFMMAVYLIFERLIKRKFKDIETNLL